MLVRSGDGEWLPLAPISSLPPGGFRAVCGPDAGRLLELDEPRFVAGFEPSFGGAWSVDAVCFSPQGAVSIVVANFGESPERTLMRLSTAAGSLQGRRVDELTALLSELTEQQSPAAWLAERTSGDVHWLEEQLQGSLDEGRFELMLVTSEGAADLATPFRFLAQGPSEVRCFALQLQQAGTVQALEAGELAIDGIAQNGASRPREASDSDSEGGQAQPTQQQPEPQPVAVESQPEPVAEVPEPVVEAPEPEALAKPKPEPEAQPDPSLAPAPAGVVVPIQAFLPEPPDSVIAVNELGRELPEAAPVAQAAPADEPTAEGDPADPQEERRSSRELFLKQVDLLDHRTTGYIRAIVEKVTQQFPWLTWMCEEEQHYLHAWLAPGDDSSVILELDSAGALTLMLNQLPAERRHSLARDLSNLLHDSSAAEIFEQELAQLTVSEHLNDETLLDYLMDNIAEAFDGLQPMEQAPDTEIAGTPLALHLVPEKADPDMDDDFFASVRGDAWESQAGSAEQAKPGAVAAAEEASDTQAAEAAASAQEPRTGNLRGNSVDADDGRKFWRRGKRAS